MDTVSSRGPLPRDPADWASAVASGGWREVRVVDRSGSTNADLAAEADAGGAGGLVLVAEHQDAGRGRLDRVWDAPPGSGLTFSVLLRPPVPPARLGWLPLLTGLAVAEALTESCGLRASVKWPNDVLVGDRKLAGVLAEVRPAPSGAAAPGTPDAVVVGIGLNVGMTEAELPVPIATSVAIEAAAVGAPAPDRAAVLRSVLDVLGARYVSWVEVAGDPEACGLRAAYTVRCATVGRTVRVVLAGRELVGEAVGIEGDGRLRVVDLTDGSTHEVAAGDVVHVR